MNDTVALLATGSYDDKARTEDTYFRVLRDQWALKAPQPTAEVMRMAYQHDQLANPHGYHNKHPRRGEAEIHSDLAYSFADEVLSNQFGHKYREWLKRNTVEKWNRHYYGSRIDQQ